MALHEIKKSVYVLTNRLQGVLGYVETGDKPKALLSVAECIAELSKITMLIALEDVREEEEKRTKLAG